MEAVKELPNPVERYMRPPEAGETCVEFLGLRGNPVCIADDEAHSIGGTSRLGDAESLRGRIQRYHPRTAGGVELSPVARAAGNLQHRSSGERRLQPTLDLAQVNLPLGLLIDPIVFA